MQAEEPQQQPEKQKKVQSENKAVFNFDKRITFIVDPHYTINKIVGRGSLGVVAYGKNNKTQQEVAVKMIMDVFKNVWEAKRELRQIKILKFLKHKNIVSLLDMMTVDDPLNYKEIYLVLQYIPYNLKQAIYSGKKFEENMIKYILFQILDAINFMHSADIIHRDLKPQNILISKNLKLKITDMNLARKQEQNSTKYVVSRPYRAPEVILSSKGYTKSIDIWSIGCIFAELLGGAMLFASQNCLEQFRSFVAILGKPNIENFKNIDPNLQKQFKELLKEIDDRPKIEWKTIYENVDEKALDLLDKMLVYDPKQRYTAEQCLNHPYLQQQRKKFPIKKCQKIFDFSFDDIPAQSSLMRQAIYNQIQEFHTSQTAQSTQKRTISPLTTELAKKDTELDEKSHKKIKKQ